jgi:hypothetical protein
MQRPWDKISKISYGQHKGVGENKLISQDLTLFA